MLKIYHNTRCTKSRCALQAIEQHNVPFELIEYLKAPPTPAELAAILHLMDKRPIDIVRQKEPLFIEKFKNHTFTDEQWLQILAENPVLIERPIIVSGDRAWVARDEATLAEILD